MFSYLKKHREIPYAYPTEGIIKDYFKEYFKYKSPFCNASCIVIPPEVFTEVGCFPEDSHTGEDLYMWMKIASRYEVCVTPNILMSYEYQESTFRDRLNRNIHIQADLFKSLYDPRKPYLNEVIAYWAIQDAIIQALMNNKNKSRSVERDFNYTRLNRKKLTQLRILNRIPSWGLWMIRKGWRAGSAVKTRLYGILEK